MKPLFLTILLLMILFTLSTASAHWVVGYVENALDGTSPEGRTVKLWNPSTGNETFGTVGVPQNSNVFMVYCDTETTFSCSIGDQLNATITNDGTGHTAKNAPGLIVTGSGADAFSENLTINSPPIFTNLTIDDSLPSPENEIDLTPATTTKIYCTGVLMDYEGSTSIQNLTAELYSSNSFFGDSDDKNYHYTNSSCDLNESYGDQTQGLINCSFDIEYYAEATSWDCRINATDNYNASTLYSDTTTINTLLALGIDTAMNFGEPDSKAVASELTVEVVNYGNVMMNLSLSGYGTTVADGNSMECAGENISIYYTKYNLTSSNTGAMNLSEFESKYTNLTSDPVTEEYNLDYRKNDITNDAKNDTYWRVYVPEGVTGSCGGNIVFGATQG